MPVVFAVGKTNCKNRGVTYEIKQIEPFKQEPDYDILLGV